MMAAIKPKVDWVYDPNTYWNDYGLLNLAGKWAVVRAKQLDTEDDYDVVTDWVDNRKTAVGFLKLLKG